MHWLSRICYFCYHRMITPPPPPPPPHTHTHTTVCSTNHAVLFFSHVRKGCSVPTCCFLFKCFQVPTHALHIIIDCKWIDGMNVVWNTKQSKHWNLLLESQQAILRILNIQRRNLGAIKQIKFVLKNLCIYAIPHAHHDTHTSTKITHESPNGNWKDSPVTGSST